MTYSPYVAGRARSDQTKVCVDEHCPECYSLYVDPDTGEEVFPVVEFDKDTGAQIQAVTCPQCILDFGLTVTVFPTHELN